jgi:hypothetical protein
MNQSDSATTATATGALMALLIIFAVSLTLSILFIISMWRVYTKAGKPGWASLIPFYNMYVLCEIGGKPGWWLLLFLIPGVNIVISILVTIGVAQNFGKGAGYALGLFFLPIIFYPMLAFGDAEHGAPSA